MQCLLSQVVRVLFRVRDNAPYGAPYRDPSLTKGSDDNRTRQEVRSSSNRECRRARRRGTAAFALRAGTMGRYGTIDLKPDLDAVINPWRLETSRAERSDWKAATDATNALDPVRPVR